MESVKYAAPELITYWWNQFGNFLTITMPTIGPSNTQWQRDIYELVTLQKFPDFPDKIEENNP